MNGIFFSRHASVILLCTIVFLLTLITSTIWFDVREVPVSSVNIISATDLPTTSNFTVSAVEVESLPAVAAAVVVSELQKPAVAMPPPVVEVSSPAGLFQYVQVTDGCGPHFEGECLNARSGPGTEYTAIASLRNGVVLKVEAVLDQEGGRWYKIVFDEWLRYPERLQGDWYVAAEFVTLLYDQGERVLVGEAPTTTKRIEVSRTNQQLVAYEGDEVFLDISISTGLAMTPTPRGIFTIFKKTPSRYMQGPLQYLPVSKYYDLPGVPWNLYFTEGGAVIHGAYWHDSFGQPYSHGCVNVPLDLAKHLYDWADLGTPVIVQD